MKALLITVLTLLGLLVVLDRVGVLVAEHQVAAQIADRSQLQGTPSVDITGFPFLTQAVGGRYREVRISLTADELGQPAGTTADVSLHGVHLPLSDVLDGSVSSIPVDRIDGRATLSYALLARQMGGDTVLAREGDGLRITRTVELLGQSVPLTAAGRVTLEDRDLVLTVDQAAGAGIDVPDFLLSQAQELLGLRYTVPDLPFGLELTGLRVADDGVVVTVQARDAVLQ